MTTCKPGIAQQRDHWHQVLDLRLANAVELLTADPFGSALLSAACWTAASATIQQSTACSAYSNHCSLLLIAWLVLGQGHVS